MKSVFFISLMNGDAWGGSEELWYQTALYAAKNGYKTGCAFYDWPQKKERIEQLKKAGVTVFLFSNKGRMRSTFWERLRYKLTKRLVRRYVKSLPLQHYDTTVINLGHLEIIDHYWKGFFSCVKNYSLLFHVHDENHVIKESRKNLLRKWMLGAKHNLFASLRIRDFLESQLSITIPHADTLINPITFPPPGVPTPYPPLAGGNYIFLMLASLDLRRKAQDNLVRVMAAEKWQKRNCILYLYGGGAGKKVVQELIDSLQLNDKVVLKGHTKEVKAALAGGHLLLQMTHIDAMPLAVIEAMAMAKPLAVSDVGDMPQWVVEDTNGWVSKDASIEEMDATLEKAWQARDRWEEMGKTSFRMFREAFPAVPEKHLLDQLNG